MTDWRRALFLLIAACAVWSPLRAQTSESFYAVNPLTIVVGSDAGGGHDLFARTLAKYIGRHLVGRPAIVVHNMPGADGLVAANYIANVAPKDGSVIAALSPGNLIEPLLQPDQAAKFDPRSMNWIGNIASIQLVCSTWISNPVKSVEDARKTQVVVGGGSSVSSSAVLPNVMNQLLGTKFKIITGYQAGNVRLALERGEIGGICGWGYSTLQATAPEWLTSGKLNFLAQSGLKRMAQLPGVPLISEFASSAEDQAIFRLLAYREVLGRPYAAPPGTPPERVAALRAAFAETMSDPEYLRDAALAHQDVDFTDHAGMEAVIADAYAMKPSVVRRVMELTRAPTK